MHCFKHSKTRKNITALHKIMAEVMKEHKLLPTNPTARNLIMKRFIKEHKVSPSVAYPLYESIYQDVSSGLDLAMLSENLLEASLEDHEKVLEIIEDGRGEKFGTENYLSGMKVRNDIRKNTSDFILKTKKIDVDKDRNVIMNKKVENESATNLFNVAMQLEGSLEEKTEKMRSILRRNMDVIDATFETIKEPNDTDLIEARTGDVGKSS